MKVRWTAAASTDLENIANYLFEKMPLNAPSLTRKIFQTVSSLQRFPNRGRMGRKAGTRELVFSSLPYIVVYQIRGEVLYIVRLLHAAQAWPG
jgi:toxin ParE1/3/4